MRYTKRFFLHLMESQWNESWHIPGLSCIRINDTEFSDSRWRAGAETTVILYSRTGGWFGDAAKIGGNGRLPIRIPTQP